MHHDDLPYRAMRELAGVVARQVNAKLVERDEAIRELEERTTEIERVLAIRRDEYHEIVLEMLVTGDETLLYQWMEDHHVTPDMIAEWERQERRR